MYLPLVKAFNYALDRLSSFKAPGLPKFREEGRIVFACSATTCIRSESYLQGSYKPDIVLVKWNTFKRAHECPNATYSQSYESNICHESGCNQPTLGWRNLLSTLEVKHSRFRNTAAFGIGPSKGKAKRKLVQPTYSREFGNPVGPEGVPAPGAPQPMPPKMVREESQTRARKFAAPSPFLVVL